MKKQLLMSLLAMTSFFAVQARHARMMMFFDIDNDESSNEKSKVVSGVVMTEAVFALYEKTAPVLMSANMWHQILFHYKQFKEKLQDINSKEYLYCQIQVLKNLIRRGLKSVCKTLNG